MSNDLLPLTSDAEHGSARSIKIDDDDDSSNFTRSQLAAMSLSPHSAAGRRGNIAVKSQEPTAITGMTESFTYVPKSVETKRIIKQALHKHYLFESISDKDLDYVIGAMSRELFATGEVLIKEGELGEKFYVIEEGRCNVLQKVPESASGKEIVVGEIEAGYCFGELALLYDTPRAATIEAAETCRIWSVSRDTFRRILASTSSSYIQEKCQFLRNVEIFKLLSNNQVT